MFELSILAVMICVAGTAGGLGIIVLERDLAFRRTKERH
jgi:hypothetical protein